MRRLSSVAVLLLTMWPQVAVMTCPVGEALPAGDSVSSGPEHMAHHGPDCRWVRNCGTAMVESAAADRAAQAAPPERPHTRLRTSDPSVTPCATDPPPPRRSA